MRDIDPTRIPPIKRGTYWHGHALRLPADAATRRYQYIAMKLFEAHAFSMIALEAAVGLDARTLGRCINGGTGNGKRLNLDASSRAKLDAAFRATCPDDPAWADIPFATVATASNGQSRQSATVVALSARRGDHTRLPVAPAPAAPRPPMAPAAPVAASPDIDAIRAQVRAELEAEYRQRFSVDQVLIDNDEPLVTEPVLDSAGKERAHCRQCNQYKRVYDSGMEALEHDGVLRSVLGDGSTRVPSVCYRCKRGYDQRIARWNVKTEAWLDERIAALIEQHLAGHLDAPRAHLDALEARLAGAADLVEAALLDFAATLVTDLRAGLPAADD